MSSQRKINRKPPHRSDYGARATAKRTGFRPSWLISGASIEASSRDNLEAVGDILEVSKTVQTEPSP